MSDLTPAAAVLTAAFSHTTATPAAPTATPTAPTATPTVTPVFVEPHSHAELTDAEGAQIERDIRDDLAKGKISQAVADARFNEMHTPLDQRVMPDDTRTEEHKLIDDHFPVAAPGDYLIQYYVPGQAPAVLPKEVQAFDANARGWMADAGLSREIGNGVVTIISKAIQHTHKLTANELETYKDNENAKLERLFGPDWHDQLKPAAVMIDELDRQRPGLKDFVRLHGDNALLITQLMQAARIYHARSQGRG